MSDSRADHDFSGVLERIDDWPVDRACAAVVGPGGVLAEHCSAAESDTGFVLASVTKLLVSHAVLLAVQEEAITLDRQAGPPGATVRHLLAHASGLDFGDREVVRRPPGTRRIYSSAGYEVLADVVAEATGIEFPDYLRQAVTEPLGMTATTLTGSAGHGAHGSLADLCAFAGELLRPRLLEPGLAEAARSDQFGDLDGVVPGYGMFKPCPWGLGPELRGDKDPHWTGRQNSERTYGHFGQSGTFLWVDPEPEVALVVLTDREFGSWAHEPWTELSDAVLGAVRPG